MILEIAVANGQVGSDSMPNRFEKLYDISVPKNRKLLTQEQREELVSETMNGVIKPYIMMADTIPRSGQINWSTNSQDVVWRCYDCGAENRIWIRVGLMDCEFDERWN